MSDFLNCYDRNLKKVAVLQNAHEIEETKEVNSIYYMNFSMPGDDPKLKFIQPFYYIRWNEDLQLYRIIKRSANFDDTDNVSIECEHVITTLCNDLLYGTYKHGGPDMRTPDTVRYLLNRQKTKNWKLYSDDDCEFQRKFEYTWKHENILNALFSIPREFSVDYMWDYDTRVYPWRLYLRRLDKEANPDFYIRAQKNLIGSTDDRDYASVYTRIYPLGAEIDGKNLTIKSVNNDIPYVQASEAVIAKYGLIEALLLDQRYENAESLMAYAQAVLNNSIEPAISRSFDVVDLYPITNMTADNAKLGSLAKLTMDNTKVFITKMTRMLDDPGNLNLEFSTKTYSITDQMANLAERIRVGSIY